MARSSVPSPPWLMPATLIGLLLFFGLGMGLLSYLPPISGTVASLLGGGAMLLAVVVVVGVSLSGSSIERRWLASLPFELSLDAYERVLRHKKSRPVAVVTVRFGEPFPEVGADEERRRWERASRGTAVWKDERRAIKVMSEALKGQAFVRQADDTLDLRFTSVPVHRFVRRVLAHARTVHRSHPVKKASVEIKGK